MTPFIFKIPKQDILRGERVVLLFGRTFKPRSINHFITEGGGSASRDSMAATGEEQQMGKWSFVTRTKLGDLWVFGPEEIEANRATKIAPKVAPGQGRAKLASAKFKTRKRTEEQQDGGESGNAPSGQQGRPKQGMFSLFCR